MTRYLSPLRGSAQTFNRLVRSQWRDIRLWQSKQQIVDSHCSIEAQPLRSW